MVSQCISALLQLRKEEGWTDEAREANSFQVRLGLGNNLWILNFILKIMKVKVKVAQLCPTLCDPKGYTVHGILQARILEWVAFPFSRGSSQPRG